MKRTIPQLADFLSELTGLSESLHQQQARRAREAGYLSQAGHGRGAAAATPMDAAMMILIAAVGLSGRYAEVVAAALEATKPDREREREEAYSLKIKGTNVVEMVASLIERRHGVERVIVGVGSPLSVEFKQDAGSATLDEGGRKIGYISCKLRAESPTGKRFSKVQNRRPLSDLTAGLYMQSTLKPWVFEEIAKFLGIEWDEDAAE